MTMSRVASQEQSTFPVARCHHMVYLPACDLLNLELDRRVADRFRDMLRQRFLGRIATGTGISQEEGIPFVPGIYARPAAEPDIAARRADIGQGAGSMFRIFRQVSFQPHADRVAESDFALIVEPGLAAHCAAGAVRAENVFGL